MLSFKQFLSQNLLEDEQLEEGPVKDANKAKKNQVARKLSKLNTLSAGRGLQKGTIKGKQYDIATKKFWNHNNKLPQDSLTTSNKMKARIVQRMFEGKL